MALRVAVAASLLMAAPLASAGWAAAPPRAGVSQVLLGRLERGLEMLEPSSPDPADQYFRAVALLGLGMTREGMEGLRRLSDRGGAFSGPALERAVGLLFDAGDYGAVTEWAQSSRADRFQDPDSFRYRLGESHARTGRADGARTQFEAVSAGPMRPYAFHSLGLLHFAEGRYREALDRLGQAIEAARTDPDPAVGSVLADRIRLTRGRVVYQFALGAGLAEADRKRLLTLAREQLNVIQPPSPMYPEALRGVGWCALESGDTARALAAFGSAASLDPDRRHEDLWAQGRVYQTAGFADEAAGLYAQAREAALVAASALESGKSSAAGRSPQAQRWDSVAGVARSTLSRLEDLRAGFEVASLATDSMEARLRVEEKGLGAARGRVRARTEELRSLSSNLADYLDQIPATALFRRAEQPRLEQILSRQDRLELEMARNDAALSALGASQLWAEADPALVRRGEALWNRLQQARARVSQVQLAFLESLKLRVSARENELAGAIERLTEDARSLEGPVARAETSIGQARSWLEGVRGRLASLVRRRDLALGRLRDLETGARQSAESAARPVAEEAARQLRLRADAYALDETEALHLWKEGGRPRGQEKRP